MIIKEVILLAIVDGEPTAVACHMFLDVEDTEEEDEALYQEAKEEYEDEHDDRVVGRIIVTRVMDEED